MILHSAVARSFARSKLPGRTCPTLLAFRSVRVTRPGRIASTGGHSFTVSDEDIQELGKVRLDAYLAEKIIDQSTSRARLQASIKEGQVMVNGKVLSKPSYVVKSGDIVDCAVIAPPPLRADPEDIPLNIVYEDEDVIVIDKSADMVMHPSPGHCSGTMVNALLFHCGISEGIPISSAQQLDASSGGSLESMSSGIDGQEGHRGRDTIIDTRHQESIKAMNAIENFGAPGRRDIAALQTRNIRPGIVHRLDKGTTGLVVVAKSDLAHASLSKQFKDRTIERTYLSITLGLPKPPEGRIVTNIGRDFRDRKKMAAFEHECTRGKPAASNYRVLETLGMSQCALVSWKLETGRTHQIRVHAKHVRHPLLNDTAYGGTEAAALRIVGQGKSLRIAATHRTIQALADRPALHAHVLGFHHPRTGEPLRFSSDPPSDFSTAIDILRTI
jgi:23S rRNA pseudouridine1911/1915/1917 synthase